MNIVEKEAIAFHRHGFLNNGKVNNLSNLKSTLSYKLYDFNKDKDKLDFLKILNLKCKEDIEKHMKSCTGCDFEQESNTAIFAIQQEIDIINEFYTFTPPNNEIFTSNEESKLHGKLNEILEKLEKQGFGQQIIFEEIEELKNHFNLGKKTWFQLLKGKLIEVTVDSVIEKTFAQEIYSNLSEGFEHFRKLID